MEPEVVAASARVGMGDTTGRCEGTEVGACSVGVSRRMETKWKMRRMRARARKKTRRKRRRMERKMMRTVRTKAWGRS
jgi:SRSO17 transposase